MIVVDPPIMRVAALDLGKVRVGLAVTDEIGAMAHPRPPLAARVRSDLLRKIKDFAEQESVDHFVVGLPLDPAGQRGPAARKAMAFAQQLFEFTGINVVLWDERFSTSEATRRLREGGHRARESRAKIDSAAACLILQAWLDSQSGRAR